MDTSSSTAMINHRLLDEENQSANPVETKPCNWEPYLSTASVFMTYAISDGLWQAVYSLLDYYKFDRLAPDEYYPAMYAVHSVLAVGAAQTLGGYCANKVSTWLNITDKWDVGDMLSSFLTGAIWSPVASLGNWLAQDEPESALSTTITMGTLFVCNLATLYTIKHVRLCIAPGTPATPPRGATFTADSTAAAAFYAIGPLSSSSETRSTALAGLFSGIGAVAGYAASMARRSLIKRFWGSAKEKAIETHYSLNP